MPRRTYGGTLARDMANSLNLDSAYAPQTGSATLVAGTVTVDTTITVNAGSFIAVQVETPGAGVRGTRYKIDARVAGVAGTGSFDITAVDSLAGDNIGNTDVSVMRWVILG